MILSKFVINTVKISDDAMEEAGIQIARDLLLEKPRNVCKNLCD